MRYTQHDSLEMIRNMGYQVVWMEDFSHQVTLVDDVRVLLIDRRVERSCAASTALDLLAESRSRRGLPEVS